MDPYPTGYFLADRSATRAEAVEVLWRTAGKPEPDLAAEGFPDVGTGSEHEKAALWARQAGVYAGEEGRFLGNAALTEGFWADISRNFLGEALYGDGTVPESILTRAELAQAAQAVWTAYDAQKASETDP